MSEASSIRVNFGRPMPLFPLDSVVLLPQQVIPLHIFEPRYRQMVGDVLDGSGQFALAVYDYDAPLSDPTAPPPIRPVVCVTQIAEHEALPDGRYNIVVQGICRAQVLEETPQEGRLYRSAMLAPLIDEHPDEDSLGSIRTWVGSMLEVGPLRHLAAAESVLAYVRNDQVPTSALLELIGFALPTGSKDRYQLLAEPNTKARAEILRQELASLGALLDRAAAQKPGDWPKGCSWN